MRQSWRWWTASKAERIVKRSCFLPIPEPSRRMSRKEESRCRLGVT